MTVTEMENLIKLIDAQGERLDVVSKRVDEVNRRIDLQDEAMGARRPTPDKPNRVRKDYAAMEDAAASFVKHRYYQGHDFHKANYVEHLAEFGLAVREQALLDSVLGMNAEAFAIELVPKLWRHEPRPDCSLNKFSGAVRDAVHEIVKARAASKADALVEKK